ncbi:MAG: dihydroneopterin triphosphate 2'-epimerase [Reinekea sp.]|jgi:D-erythro-7,8-dihydroneopterin triphosphate epimerase|nr:dihydroneopterin triphosphate 2'-epimerase [Reinekea sp.]MDX1473329.1 dihydroneopterin triphosphate 2'-epimerase [Reinekea sp.]
MRTAIINIKNLRLRTYIGFNPEELEKQQDVVINAEIHYPADQALATDSESNAVNYKDITKKMIQHVEQGQFKLLEKLAGDLLDIAQTHPDVLFARVSVDKPHALRFADSVSITMESHSRAG